MGKVFVIAEAGVNHNGSLRLARKMVAAAARAGADAVKFQTFRADELVSANSPKAPYQQRTTSADENQLEMLQRLELKEEAFKSLIKYCHSQRISFISSPFDLPSIELLSRLGVRTLKIPSGEITNVPYLRKIGALKKKIILSTGMATLAEIKQALVLLKRAGTRKKDIIVLHCHSEYPTPMNLVNLKVMPALKKALGVEVGYSDHTVGIEIPIAAAALGAMVIEKHFTLSRKLKGPDHQASIEPSELAAMVRAIRNVEKALGNTVKKPSAAEKINMRVVRKSIVAAGDIFRGEKFSEQNLTLKRPGTGLSPLLWDKVLGLTARRDFRKDELITL